MEDHQILKEAIKLAARHTPQATYVVYVDFTRPANEHRFFLVNIDDQNIEYSWYTSHGKGSGPLEHCDKFSNVPESKCSSKGLMKTAGTYSSAKFGYALRLDGLEKGINDHVRQRAIVIHPSKYVSQDYMEDHEYPGRSWGCITLDPKMSVQIIDKIKNGSIVYVKGD